ncbi:acyl-CoA N-acyltransferase [Sistotremastrum niveocremeum HHB9708]|uniref:Acyl-CoA N-acyltransferase n=1 Tax=Sistotremastrum niveocremeum HHB9708 TaxID=1314777 RepID=A0A164SBD9_9AGAM|nr:acyl-CoA N-acyltransferase [Sistotremastrum niveocremeum HHB9708]
MERPPHEIIVLPGPGEADRKRLLDQCIAMRIEVFVGEQGFDLDTEVDQYDDTATHFLLRLTPSLQPIGTIRAVSIPGGYKLGRLVVVKEFRQFGFGRDLVLKMSDWAREVAGSEPVEIVAYAQLYVKAFYAKYGYVPEGDEQEVDGAPHQKMVLRINPSSA